MRVPAALLLMMAAVLAPGLGLTDPAQPGTAAAAPAATTSVVTAPSATAATTPQSSAPVSAATPDETVVVNGKAQNDEVNDPNRIECRKEPPETGSRLGGDRKCLTLRAWNNLRGRSQEMLENVQMHGLMGGRGY